jgi:hypothetical protein
MKATSHVFVSNKGDDYFRADDICAAPDGSLYFSDWYDGGVGGHAYNDRDRGRVFLLRPKGEKPRRIGKPGPYQSVAEAIEGLKSPNLATQYVARERLLVGGQDAVSALKALVNDAEPNYRARALWLLDRLGGEARKVVVDQCKNPDDAMRALAVRILRRHGSEQADVILAMAADPSLEVRREVLLAMPKLPGPKSEQVLVELASTYDGRDRYQLEAINIAAGDRKASLFAALESAGKASIDNLPLLQLLDAKKATALAVKALADSNEPEAIRAAVLDHLSVSSSADACLAVVRLAADDKATSRLRETAGARLGANLMGTWRDVRDKPELLEGIR